MSGFSCMETAKRNNKPKLVLTMAPGVITVEGSELCFRNQKMFCPRKTVELACQQQPDTSVPLSSFIDVQKGAIQWCCPLLNYRGTSSGSQLFK